MSTSNKPLAASGTERNMARATAFPRLRFVARRTGARVASAPIRFSSWSSSPVGALTRGRGDRSSQSRRRAVPSGRLTSITTVSAGRELPPPEKSWSGVIQAQPSGPPPAAGERDTQAARRTSGNSAATARTACPMRPLAPYRRIGIGVTLKSAARSRGGRKAGPLERLIHGGRGLRPHRDEGQAKLSRRESEAHERVLHRRGAGLEEE